LRSENQAQAASAWIEDPEKGVDLTVPSGLPGVWTITAASPSPLRAAKVAAAAIAVAPRVLPKLAAKVSGGRAAPGGVVDVDVDLTDEKGAGLTGTVAAIVVDLHGGGSVGGLERVDARRSVCARFGIDSMRCDRFVEGDPTLDALRRAVLGEQITAPLAPAYDPGGSARAELDKTFGEVMHSLEGAVFEASASADRLLDVRRRAARAYGWNPELMTLVTAAMSEPPKTPGGEALSLADLLNVDPQVTFDNVARRVTRLKLFYVLQRIRAYKHDRQIEPDEPILKDPNALLRRLVRQGTITEDMLLDPWGGTLQFVPAQGAPIPFLTVIRGFELRAPGPDGRAGTGDDVRDPFERVLKSGTPYARAVGEDRIVDARYDVEVADSSVSAWEALLEELTGTRLGSVGHGSGTGSGQGFGSGHGRLAAPQVRMGATSRMSGGLTNGVAWWSPPERTDAKGHVRFHVPLGDAETTWRVALVGVPDAGPRATSWVDVPVALPLSARVDAGATWIEGDRVDVAVMLRNRTQKPVQATVRAGASGAVRLASAESSRAVDVPAGGATVTRIPLVAAAPGLAKLDVTVTAPGLPDDVLRHTWQVEPAGEPTDLTRSQWVERKATLEAALGERRLADSDAGPLPVRLVGSPRLVLERGIDRPLAAALEAMQPDRLRSREALADAIEVAARVGRWATAKQGDGSALAARATEVLGRARGRLVVFGGVEDSLPQWLVDNRLRPWVPPDSGSHPRAACPPDDARTKGLLRVIEGEPAPESGSALACWDALVAAAADDAQSQGDPVTLARTFLAIADRPHRAALAATLLERLREKVAVRPSGAIALPEVQAKDRSSRAIVYAALLRGARTVTPSPATPDRLAAWIGVQRDADGGYGSALATREVVRALLESGVEEQGTSRVAVVAGKERRELTVPPSARVELMLDPSLVSVALEVEGPSLVARLERPVVRLWSSPSPSPESPLHLSVAWPSDARAGRNGVVSVSIRHSRGRPTAVDVRIPLPVGVSLASRVQGVRQLQGVLIVRRSLDASGLATQIDVPVRFALSGRLTVPEARAFVAFEEVPRALAPARPLVVMQ
jgi:hypothetical protein